eukprot:1307379-Prymnesium_polylepis.1
MTLCDELLYHGVTHNHLLSYAWSACQDFGSPGKMLDAQLQRASAPLLEVTQRFNDTANVVSSAVVGTAPLFERAALIAHFVAVALELRKLHNYNGVMAVLAGLGNAAVHRLRCSKSRISRQARADWESLS